MTAPSAKLRLPDVLEDFAAYYEQHGGWSALEPVLGTVSAFDDAAVDAFADGAQVGTETWALACILRELSYSQRSRLARKVHQLCSARQMQRSASGG